jgi:hypothetical protein
MKIKVNESQIMKLMKIYMDRFYPSLSEPLTRRRRYSTDENYTYYDSSGVLIASEYLHEDESSSRFEVFTYVDPLMGMFNMFGKDMFEEYFRQVLDLDISDPKDFDNSWEFGF